MKLLPHISTPLEQEDIIQDKSMLATKSKVMGSMRWNSVLNSISTIGALIGGPLLAGGIIGLANSLFKEAAVAGAAVAAEAGTFAAIGGLPVVAMLGVGAVFVGISVASTYVASRIWQSKQFDNYEITAKSTAHHMIEELKANHLCLSEEHDHKRADGKSWQQYTQERRAAQQGVQVS